MLQACAEAGVAVVPFGGGTSVVGGLEPERGGARRARLARPRPAWTGVLGVDERSLTAVLEPGLRLPEADRALAAHGLHARPRAAELRVGDASAAASRRARPARRRPGTGGSTRTSWRCGCATPAGELATLDACRRPPPARRCASCCVGSEGALGVLTEVTLRVRPAAERARATRAGSRTRFAEGVRRAARARAGRRRAGRRAALRRGRDALSARARRRAGRRSAAAPAARAATARLPADPRLGGRAGRRSRAGARPAARLLRAAGAMSPGARPGEAWRRALRRPAPARRPARPRRARRDARDGDHVVAPGRAAPRRAGGAARLTRRAARRLPRLAPLRDRRVAVLHRARRARTDDPVAQWRAAKAAASRAIVAAGARSPTTTRSAATTRRGWAPRTARSALERPARGQGAAGPRLGHEPRASCSGRRSGAQRGAPALTGLQQRPCRPCPGSRPGCPW